MTTGQIELAAIAERLTQVEREIADIKQGSGSRQMDSEPWYLKHAGRFKGDAEFQEIVRLGREIRDSDRPD
jgi:hypothetical protein